MGRIPKVLCLENGDIRVRAAVIPRPIALVVQRVCDRLKVPFETGLTLFYEQISAMLSVGQGAFLGPMFELALKQTRDENFGVIDSGSAIDVSLLHRSTKLKSGYAGVYANGNGFRAVGPGGKYIVTAPSVEEAAWRRRLFYVENGLPYGELEVEIDRWEADNAFAPGMTMRDKVAMFMQHANRVGTAHLFQADADRIIGEVAPTPELVNPTPGFDPFEAAERHKDRD